IYTMNWDKRSIIYFSIFIIISLALAAGAYFAYKYVFDEEPVLEEGTAKTYEDVIKDLTAPRGAGNEVAEEVMRDLTTEEQLPEVSKEIIDSLTAPE
ncbi:hypothetical protein KKE99_00770, partial [Patescibacteria group bacterium]|nr:hypothetical protein [Patescibacteria group bacterium]